MALILVAVHFILEDFVIFITFSIQKKSILILAISSRRTFVFEMVFDLLSLLKNLIRKANERGFLLAFGI